MTGKGYSILASTFPPAPTKDRCLPCASTSVGGAGSSGGVVVRSKNAIVGTRIGSCDRDFPSDCARSSSGSKCTAPGEWTAALACSSEIVGAFFCGVSCTGGDVGYMTGVSGCRTGDGTGERLGVVTLLAVGLGLMISGLYVLGSSCGGVVGRSINCGVLWL